MVPRLIDRSTYVLMRVMRSLNRVWIESWVLGQSKGQFNLSTHLISAYFQAFAVAYLLCKTDTTDEQSSTCTSHLNKHTVCFHAVYPEIMFNVLKRDTFYVCSASVERDHISRLNKN